MVARHRAEQCAGLTPAGSKGSLEQDVDSRDSAHQDLVLNEANARGQLVRHKELAISVTAASAVATAAVATLSAVDFAYRAPSLHVALETAAFLIALLAAWLFFGRFLRTGSLADLVLVCALASLAFANLVSVATGLADESSRFGTWVPIAGRVLGSALFAAAALVPNRSIRRPRYAIVGGLSALGAVLLFAASMVVVLGDGLPVGVETSLALDASHPDLDGHPIVLAVQLVTMSLFGAAALGFWRRATRADDELLAWVTIGAVFAAFARLNYFLYPSLYSDWVYTGDVFRLLFYVALLVGAAREIRTYWESLAHTAVLEERRRIARDLHDGAAQEFSFILRRVRLVDDDSMRKGLAAAAQRGLEDLRHAIAALTRPVDQSLDAALEEALRPIAARNGTRLELDLSEDVRVAPAVREELVRIACAAVTNATTHSGAHTVAVELANADGVKLCVRDDGSGFDPTSVTTTIAGGFGLVSMRQRAEQLGAHLVVDSSVGEGTRIEVALPRTP